MSSFASSPSTTTQLFVQDTEWSAVERAFLQHSGRQAHYPGERVPVVEVQNVYELGRVVALAFLEWVVSHPQGVVALPTGKTPEFFIRTLDRYRQHWHSEDVQAELRAHSFPSPESFPETSGLKFVMLDEFFPMLPSHRNSFVHYVRTFYLAPLRISAENVLDFDLLAQNVLSPEEWRLFEDSDIDLSLLTRSESDLTLTDDERRKQLVLRKVENFCVSFEERIKAWGGIGFFLGGIGPDGHIAFNQEGAAHDSITRLVSFNYPTAAAAAGDLGGIERARGKAAMTIGLRTITANADAKIVIMAAGEGKASVIRAAVESEPATNKHIPSTALHNHRGVRFYVTHGAALSLSARQAERVCCVSQSVREFALAYLSGLGGGTPGVPDYLLSVPSEYTVLETALYSLSLLLKVPVHALVPAVQALLQSDDANNNVTASTNSGKELESASGRSLSALTPAQSSAKTIALSLPLWLRSDTLSLSIVCAAAARRLREKVQGGIAESSLCDHRLLHTAPHHDDIMLSYHGAMHALLGRQKAGEIFDAEEERERERDTAPRSPKAVSKTQSATSYAKQALHNSALRRGRANSFSLSLSTLGEKYNGNTNHFAYLTSGFHSVNDDVLREKCDAVLATMAEGDETLFLDDAVAMGQLTREYDDILCEFRAGFLAKDEAALDYIENIIFLRKVAEVWSLSLTQNCKALQKELRESVEWIRDKYLAVHAPGDAIPKQMQLLKGCIRETEVDRVWALSKMPNHRVHHLRSKFYTDDFFTPMPSLEDDALPMANLLRARQPHVLTVAFDPEGTGPDTHYKVLQVVAAGLRVAMQRGDLTEEPLVWGYRNVWFVFPPSQATLFIPVSASDLDLMHDTFMACFSTQKKASFPSPLYDGPFSAWARDIQRGQREMLGTLLGEEFFTNHTDARVRESAGFVLIHAMPAAVFLQEVEELKSKFENI